MPGLILLLAVSVLVGAGVAVRGRSEVISNTAFLLAAALLVLAVLAFARVV
ncbi:MAG: hypothetical protein ACLFSJ_05875 [Halorhodospira sp.]